MRDYSLHSGLHHVSISIQWSDANRILSSSSYSVQSRQIRTAWKHRWWTSIYIYSEQVPPALSSTLRPHSMGCQFRHIIQLVHIFAASKEPSLPVIFVCIFCAYRDVSDFLWVINKDITIKILYDNFKTSNYVM